MSTARHRPSPQFADSPATSLNQVAGDAVHQLSWTTVALNGSCYGTTKGDSSSRFQDHPRHHLDLYAHDQTAEIERLIELGRSGSTTGTAIAMTPTSSSLKTPRALASA